MIASAYRELMECKNALKFIVLWLKQDLEHFKSNTEVLFKLYDTVSHALSTE